MSTRSDNFKSFEDLTAAYQEGIDYRVHARPIARSRIAVIAPHGGSIESHTSEIAGAIARSDFNLYLFEGIRPHGNYDALHLTSHRFDEPRCLKLISECDYVVAIHGCRGHAAQVLIGGLDQPLKDAFAHAIEGCGVNALLEGHQFPATEPNNICNRGRRAVGAQIEMTMALRRDDALNDVTDAVRSVLLSLQAA